MHLILELVLHHPTNDRYNEFSNKFMDDIYTILHGNSLCRMFLEYKRLLQFILHSAGGDWFLLDNHTKIRIYGCKIFPQHLFAFITLINFSLEYIGQIFKSDEVQFRKNRSIITFRIPQQIGPFTVKIRTTQALVKEMLKDLNLPLGFKRNYDTMDLISEKRKNLKLVEYVHHPLEQLDMIKNLESLEEVQRIIFPGKQRKYQTIPTLILADAGMKRTLVERTLIQKGKN